MKKTHEHLGNYHLLRLLGQGGFADVYLGKHIHLDTSAAIKILRMYLHPNEIEAFRKEGRTIARLLHPHIIRLLDYDVQDGIPFLVMDYAPHGSLRERYPQGTRLSFQQIQHYLQDIASAVQYAHDQGIIHRDLKPENILLGPQKMLWLSDFGLALERTTRSEERSSQIAVAGTLSYMAPEQFQGHPSPASDQYALATLVYEWVCGKHPFEGESFFELATQKMSQLPPRPNSIVSGVPPKLEEVLLRALAPRPEDRFESVAAFATAVHRTCIQTSAPNSFPPHRLLSAPTLFTSASAPRGKRASPTQILSTQHASPSGKNTHLHTKLLEVEEKDPYMPLHPLTPSASPFSQHWSRRTMLAGLVGIGTVASIGIIRALATQPPSLHGMRPVTTTHVVPSPNATSVLPATTLEPSPTPSPVVPMSTPIPTPLPQGTQLLTYTGHTSPIESITWSPDGTRIASASLDTTVQVFDAQTGTRLLTYHGHNAPVYDVAWSPDGTRIASGGSDSTVQIWHASNGQLLQTYRGHTLGVRCLCWSPDGMRIASGGSLDMQIQVFQASTGTQIFTQNLTQPITSLAWSPAGTPYGPFLAYTEDNDRYVYLGSATSTARWQLTYIGHKQLPYCVAWSPNGKQLASGAGDGQALIWDNISGHIAQRLMTGGPFEATNSLAWSPDGIYLALGTQDEHSVSIWNPQTGIKIFTYQGHTAPITRVQWSPDGTRLASASLDSTVQILIAKF